MSWQEIAALSIVGLTVLAFVWAQFRRQHRGPVPGCGCSGSSERPPSVVLQAKKGQRPKMIVKMR